ncbi:MAG: hypothetical protein Q8W44_05740 [Candidatus Palauibacterales bacterium]|nr:hypothetical protein [Candidatus Palauibacterales bacterium]
MSTIFRLPAGRARRCRVLASAALALTMLLLGGQATPVGAQTDSTPDSVETVPVTAESGPAVRLAFHDLGQVRIPRDTVDIYEDLIRDVAGYCQYGNVQVAALGRSASRVLKKVAGMDVSARNILERTRRSVQGSLAGRPDCRGVVLSVLAGLGGEDISSSMPNVHELLVDLPDPGGG